MTKLLPIILPIALTTMGVLAINLFTNYYFYHDIKEVNDKQEVIQKAGNSLPVQAVITHKNWGTLQIDDEVRLYSITSLLNIIEQQHKAIELLKFESDFLSCTITYLNGTKKRYFIKESLIKNEYKYDSSYPKSTVIALYTHLLNLFYTPEKIATFASQADEITLKDHEQQQSLSSKEKNAFFRTLQTATELSTYKLWNNSHQSLQRPNGYVTIYQDEQQASLKSEAIIHITVFQNYFTVRYLGDPNGNAIHFAGDLTSFLPVGRKES
nr:DUF3919 family protein [Neobacillus sp. Marseille-Q6967]